MGARPGARRERAAERCAVRGHALGPRTGAAARGTRRRPGAIAVTCSWTVTPPATDPAKPPPGTRSRAAFALYPQLYALPVPGSDAPVPDPTAAVRAVFGAEQIGPGQVVQFSNPTAAPDTHWFSVDHKGGSFLCRPAVDIAGRTVSLALADNDDRLPAWGRIDAAFELKGGTRYFVDNGAQTYLEVPATATRADGTSQLIADRWGRLPRPTPNPAVGTVDAVIVRGGQTFVVVGRPVPALSLRALRPARHGLPARHRRQQRRPAAVGPDRRRVPRAGRDGVLLHPPAAPQPGQGQPGQGQPGAGAAGGAHARGAQEEPRPLPDLWGLRSPVDAAVVDEANVRTFVFAGDQYVRFSGRSYDRPDAGYPRRIADADPADRLPSVSSVRAAYLVGRTLWCSTTERTGRRRAGATSSRCRSVRTAPWPRTSSSSRRGCAMGTSTSS